jgi:hypothetical protein
MKYLKSYNESLRNLMTPKSEEEILNSLKISNINNTDLLIKSLDNNFYKGVEIALNKKPKILNYNFFREKIFNLTDKKIIELVLTNDNIKYVLNNEDKYILEKYKLGLHQNEERIYEKWINNKLNNIKVFNSNLNNIVLYEKNNKVLFNYFIKENVVQISQDMWTYIQDYFRLDYKIIIIILKNILENKFNIKILDIYPISDRALAID